MDIDTVDGIKPLPRKKWRPKPDKEERIMLDTLGATMSPKEHTKTKFEQLLKAALEDSKNRETSLTDSKQKRSHKRSDVGAVQESGRKDAISAVRELKHGIEPGVEVKKSSKGKKKKRKGGGGDEEGLINPAFDHNEKLVPELDDRLPICRVEPKKKQHRKKELASVPEVTTVQTPRCEFGSEFDSEYGRSDVPLMDESRVLISDAVEALSSSGHVQSPVTALELPGVQLESWSVKVHRVDRLRMNFAIKHPLVRVHVVNGQTGAYLKTQDRNAKVTYVQPVMTQPFDLKLKRSLVPVWEESLLFDEPFDHFVHPDSNSILFFEILDFLPMAAACGQYAHLGVDSGWYRVAWAFLKLVGTNGVLNTDHKVQLQLYCPPKQRIRPEPRIVDVFHWWASLPRVKYPATLYVTVSKVCRPANVEPNLRSSALLRDDRKAAALDPRPKDHHLENAGHDSVASSLSKDVQSTPFPWSRLPGQSCKVPNRLSLRLPTAAKGCFSACFSNSGRLIACGCFDGEASSITIYKIPSGELCSRVTAHSGLIYEMHFSKMDKRLVSTSADSTARVWTVDDSDAREPDVTLPHPTYVYTARFHPANSHMVATGCYDTVLRIWSIASGDRHGQLLQELEGHRANVNTLCFNAPGTILFSGDGKGVIQVWTTGHEDRSAAPSWSLHQEVVEPDLVGVSISLVVLHPTLPRLVVQGQDGAVRLLDLQSFQVVRRYDGYLNVREYLRGCITPCGHLFFTGSEDGCGYVWNTMTGDQVAVYSELPCGRTIHCVVYHPHDHLVAFCSYGDGTSPVAIYRYDPSSVQLGISRVAGPVVSDHSALLASSTVVSVDHSASPAVNATNPSTGMGSETIYQKIMRRLDSVLQVSQHEMDSGLVELPSIPGWGSTFDGLNINPDAPVIQKVVALYDYNARRSDEATFKKGDVIDILCRESDEWWIGKTGSGQFGYVPTNHITAFDVDGPATPVDPDDNQDLLRPDSKPRAVAAVLTKSGHLAFVSASEDEDGPVTSTPNRRQRRRRRKEWELHAAQFEHSDV